MIFNFWRKGFWLLKGGGNRRQKQHYCHNYTNAINFSFDSPANVSSLFFSSPSAFGGHGPHQHHHIFHHQWLLLFKIQVTNIWIRLTPKSNLHPKPNMAIGSKFPNRAFPVKCQCNPLIRNTTWISFNPDVWHRTSQSKFSGLMRVFSYRCFQNPNIAKLEHPEKI